MNAAQLDGLHQHRDALTELLQKMMATPEAARPEKPSALAQWLANIESTQRLIGQITALIKQQQDADKPQRKPTKRAAATPGKAVDAHDLTVIACMPKTARTELRVTSCVVSGQRRIDVRLWSKFTGRDDHLPTRKGVQVAADDLGALIDALRMAQQHA